MDKITEKIKGELEGLIKDGNRILLAEEYRHYTESFEGNTGKGKTKKNKGR